MILPPGKAELIRKVVDVKESCRVSAPRRAAMCRALNQWIETGKADGTRALVNKLYAHNERLASHLYSPTELRFDMDFESHYPTDILAMGETTARVITREWERKDIDMLFGNGVKVGLDYGAAILKQMWGHSGVDARLVMPWCFGVYREDVANLDDQEALCESGLMTLAEVWRRISHLKDAEAMYRRILAHAEKNSGDPLNNSFFHNVVSSNVLNTDLATQRQQPGGIVQLSDMNAMGLLAPEIEVDLVQYHEMYIKDDDLEDYVTVLLIEPDILISPRLKRENQFAPKTQPFSLIQPNSTPGYLWGRPEVLDLIEPQGLLAQWFVDVRRMQGLQVDKILAFTGADGITDERYAEFRNAGYIDLPAGSDVKDLTPQFPPQMFQSIEVLNRFMEEVSGFGNILSGQGEPGVRAGNQAETMVKMASPRMRDRALLVERQCAAAADKTLDLLQAKDGRKYTTDATTGPAKEFLLYDLPDDRRVTVDSHSSSPVFADDHAALISLGIKAGFIGGDSAIDMLPYPRKSVLRDRYAKMQAAKQKMIQEHPEILTHQKPKR